MKTPGNDTDGLLPAMNRGAGLRAQKIAKDRAESVTGLMTTCLVCGHRWLFFGDGTTEESGPECRCRERRKAKGRK